MTIRAMLLCIGVAVVVASVATQPGRGQGAQAPPTRSFHLGLTPWPPDFTAEGVDEAYRLIAEHCDLICHHLDDGIPWPEALAGTPYPPQVEQNLRDRVARTPPGHKVYLAVTPLNMDRRSLAGYWSDKSNGERPDPWKEKAFDDPDVIAAYIAFCRDLIRRFHPDYMAYGIEVDADLKAEDPAFPQFVTLVREVYTTLKAENPELPLFLTFTIGGFGRSLEQQRTVDEPLLPYTDYIAVSTYPFWAPSAGRTDGNPSTLPADWFRQKTAIAPEKPFAVAETGFIAEDLVLKTLGVDIKGTPEWQAQYVEFLLRSVQDLNGQFVVWFCGRDYDQGWEKIAALGLPEFFKTWRDTGFVDGADHPRPALEVWDAWLHRPWSRP